MVPDGGRSNRGTPVPATTAEEVSVGTTANSPFPTCQRCGFEVLPLPWGCKNPCPSCGFLHPLGDCSD